MKNNIKSEINTIEIPDEMDTYIQSGVDLAKIEKQQDKKIRLFSFFQIPKNKKILYTISVTVIALLLLINTLAHSKTILAYASEIPVISDMFELEPLSEQIIQELEEKDFYTDNIDISISVFTGKEITIVLGGTSDYQKAIRDDIEQTVEKFLLREQYDSFTINVKKQDEQTSYHLSIPQQTEKEKMEKEIKKLLSNLNIEAKFIFVEPLDKYISVNVNTSINNEKKLQEYAQSVKKELINNTDFEGYGFYVTASGPEMSVDNHGSTFTPSTDLDRKIGRLARMLTEKEVYKVTGFSVKEEPLIFKIRTSVSASDKEHGKYIKNVIEDYFNSTVVPPKMKSDSYQLYIYSKDGKQIN